MKIKEEREWNQIILIIMILLLIGSVTVRGGIALIDKAKLDSISNTLVVTDYSLYGIHEGDAFTFTKIGTSVAKGGSLNITVNTPSTDVFVHLLFEGSATNTSRIILYENSVNTSSGTQVWAINRKRDDVVNMTSTIYLNQIISGGNILAEYYFGINGRGGAVGRDLTEWVLNKSTQYSLSIISDGNNNDLSISVNFLEIPDIR